MKKNLFKTFLILGPVLILSGCGQKSSQPSQSFGIPLEQVNSSKVISCKYGPDSRDTDKLYFDSSSSKVTWTTSNKNRETESFDFVEIDEGYLLKGIQKTVNLDKSVTEEYKEMYYLISKETGYDIFYFDDYETDPVKLMYCW